MPRIDWILPPASGIRRLAEFQVGPFSGVVVDYNGKVRLSIPLGETRSDFSGQEIQSLREAVVIAHRIWRSGGGPDSVGQATTTDPPGVRVWAAPKDGQIRPWFDPIWLRPNDLIACVSCGRFTIHIFRDRTQPHQLAVGLHEGRNQYLRSVVCGEDGERLLLEICRIVDVALIKHSDRASSG